MVHGLSCCEGLFHVFSKFIRFVLSVLWYGTLKTHMKICYNSMPNRDTFYIVNNTKIKEYEFFSKRSYGTFNRDTLKKFQTVRLIQTVRIIETWE